jgi:hypothetical protein
MVCTVHNLDSRYFIVTLTLQKWMYISRIKNLQVYISFFFNGKT